MEFRCIKLVYTIFFLTSSAAFASEDVFKSVFSTSNKDAAQEYSKDFDENIGSVKKISYSETYGNLKKKADLDYRSSHFQVYKEGLRVSLGLIFSNALKECHFAGDRQMHFILRISDNGSIEEVAPKAFDSVSSCVRQKLKGKKVEKPPRASFHLEVRIETKQELRITH